METNELMIHIAMCEDVKKAKDNPMHPCHDIVSNQTGEFQLPEPWNGDIESAEILFISSNPSIDEMANTEGHEIYPTEKYDKDKLTEFFTDRFKTTQKEFYSKYWKRIFKWATWILPDVSEEEIPNKIVMTEVVHCKSHKQRGVDRCICFCAKKWLEQVITAFKGKYVVIVGEVAKKFFETIKEYAPDKVVAYTSHPGYSGQTDEKRREGILEQLHLLKDAAGSMVSEEI